MRGFLREVLWLEMRGPLKEVLYTDERLTERCLMVSFTDEGPAEMVLWLRMKGSLREVL